MTISPSLVQEHNFVPGERASFQVLYSIARGVRQSHGVGKKGKEKNPCHLSKSCVGKSCLNEEERVLISVF
jgi:hypothetical protein